jgi:hypothetical protein
VEASDIEMTELLFNGCRAFSDREKKTEIVDVISVDKKKEPSKKVECNLTNKNKPEKYIKYVKSERKKRDLFDESGFVDPYELKYGHIYSDRF